MFSADKRVYSSDQFSHLEDKNYWLNFNQAEVSLNGIGLHMYNRAHCICRVKVIHSNPWIKPIQTV